MSTAAQLGSEAAWRFQVRVLLITTITPRFVVRRTREVITSLTSRLRSFHRSRRTFAFVGVNESTGVSWTIFLVK